MLLRLKKSRRWESNTRQNPKEQFWIATQNPPHCNRMLWAVETLMMSKGISVAYGVRLRDCGAWVYVVDAHLHDCLIYHYLHHQINAIY